MDRVVPTRRGDGLLAEPTPDGWSLDAEHDWVVSGPSEFLDAVVDELGTTAQRLTTGVVQLSFGNAVGRYRGGPLGVLRVRSGKWTETDYTALLAEISAQASALPFHAGAASALPYARTDLDAPNVAYHAFVWLRHAILEVDDSPLIGALRAILADPHRSTISEQQVVPAERAVDLSFRGLEEVAAGVRPMRRVPAGRGLLGGEWFPVEVAESVSRSTVNTAENRFVRAFVETCGHVVEAMRRRHSDERTLLARRVCADCHEIAGSLLPIMRHRMWEEVGRARMFPACSTVLQRRHAYAEVLRHHVLLQMASKALPLDEAEVQQLLEVKDIARLYELWTAFAVIGAVQECKGPPVEAKRVDHDEMGAALGGGLIARWADGTEVAYNREFTRRGGFHGRSWSVDLRPDVALWVPTGPSTGLHLLDAKFRLAGGLDAQAEAGVEARRADLHKMHTYRDAIREARSAWVMYPGTVFRAWCSDSRVLTNDDELPSAIVGVGAVPVVPSVDNRELHRLIAAMLGCAASRVGVA